MSVDLLHKSPRLYVDAPALAAGQLIELSGNQHHYLRNVMRIEAGGSLRLFNGRDGDWAGEVKEVSKKNVLISVLDLINQQKPGPDIEVLASPVKKEALDFMVEKSCELGAARFRPVACDHTVVHRINRERLQAVAVEAAEQSERLDIMQVELLNDLKDILKTWDKSRKLIFCIERKGAPLLTEVLRDRQTLVPPLALLVGPEGGFSAAETESLLSLDYVLPVSLGPRILRAETALVAALGMLSLQAESVK